MQIQAFDMSPLPSMARCEQADEETRVMQVPAGVLLPHALADAV